MALVFSSDSSVRSGVVLALVLAAALAVPAANDPWWYDPCKNNPVRLRHHRSAASSIAAPKYVSPIHFELDKISSELGKGIEQIKELYHQRLEKVPSYGKLKWLKVGKTLKSLKKQSHDLVELHTMLQHVAGTVQVLEEMVVNTPMQFDDGKRRGIYEAFKLRLRSLLCEVHEVANRKRVRKVPLRKMKVSLPKTLDVTGLQMLDSTFLGKIKSFFIKCQKIMFKKKVKSKSKNGRKSSAVKAKRT